MFGCYREADFNFTKQLKVTILCKKQKSRQLKNSPVQNKPYRDTFPKPVL